MNAADVRRSVAEAIYESAQTYDMSVAQGPWGKLHADDRRGYEEQAAAASAAFIAAIEEPSEGMHDAGNAAVANVKNWEYAMQVIAEDVWRAMLAKLKQEIGT